MKRLLFAALALLAAGCSPDGATCEDVALEGAHYCVYQGPITETGYVCPSEMPNLYRDEMLDVAVCSAESDRPPFDEIEMVMNDQTDHVLRTSDAGDPNTSFHDSGLPCYGGLDSDCRLGDVIVVRGRDDDDACPLDPGHPGPDLFAIALQSGTTTVGWADVISSEIQSDGNDSADPSVLNGEPAYTSEPLCPPQRPGDVVSLGCGSSYFVAVHFRGPHGATIELQGSAGLEIRVFAWGGQCEVGTPSSRYDVAICTDSAAVAQGDVSSCTIPVITDGSDESSGSVVF